MEYKTALWHFAQLRADDAERALIQQKRQELGDLRVREDLIRLARLCHPMRGDCLVDADDNPLGTVHEVEKTDVWPDNLEAAEHLQVKAGDRFEFISKEKLIKISDHKYQLIR